MTEHIPFGTQPDPRPPQRTALQEALAPFLAFASLPSFDKLPRSVPMSGGSPISAPQLTVGHFLDLKAAAEQATKPVVWSPPPMQERPEGFECLVWHRGRWRHVRWVRNHNMWMFGYGSPGISNELGRQFAPLPDLNPGIYGDFWAGERS